MTLNILIYLPFGFFLLKRSKASLTGVVLDWKAACDLTLSVLFPSVLWLKLLRYLQISADIVAHHGFEIILKPIPT